MSETARKPAMVAGALVGIIIAGLFAWLFGILDSESFGSGPVLVILVLLVGWALWCAFSFGPATDDD
jgi:hypothetical protein